MTAPDAAEPEPQPAPEVEAVLDLGLLPEPVRARLLALASEALGALAADQVPAGLRTVARFTPSKRARLAAGPLAGALESDPLFRQRVGEYAKGTLAPVADALQSGTPPPAAPPADVVAVAYLLRPSGWRETVAAAAAAAERDIAAASAAEEVAAQRRRVEALKAARTAARAGTDRLKSELDRLRHDNDELRHRLGQARDRARKAEAELAEASRAAAADAAAGDARVAAAEAELRRLRAKLAETEASLEAARRAGRETRSAEDARRWLLLDTLVNAAQGLRRELGLPPPATRPADLVGTESGRSPFAGVAARGLEADDPAVFDQLLALPGVHLVVDGYNVTKSGYGGLVLEAQRTRLVAGLAALAARTGCEVTCVFDGAVVDVPVVTPSARGVRVRFSAPGETADELIRRLVRAEPEGRPVVVVSSDKEVADGVRRAGARAVSAASLLRRLDRS